MPQEPVNCKGEEGSQLPEDSSEENILCGLGNSLVLRLFVERAALELLQRSGQSAVTVFFWAICEVEEQYRGVYIWLK